MGRPSGPDDLIAESIGQSIFADHERGGRPLAQNQNRDPRNWAPGIERSISRGSASGLQRVDNGSANAQSISSGTGGERSGGALPTIRAAELKAALSKLPDPKAGQERDVYSGQTWLDWVLKFCETQLREFIASENLYGGEIGALTESEARTLLRAGSLDSARDRIFEAGQNSLIAAQPGVFSAARPPSRAQVLAARGYSRGNRQRLAEANEAFEAWVQVAGVVQFPGEPASRVVTVEPWRVADPQRSEPRQREIDVYLRARKSHWPRRSQDSPGRQGDFSAVRLSAGQNITPMSSSEGRGHTVQQGNISEQSPSGTGSTVWVDPNTGGSQDKAQDLVNRLLLVPARTEGTALNPPRPTDETACGVCWEEW